MTTSSNTNMCKFDDQCYQENFPYHNALIFMITTNKWNLSDLRIVTQLKVRDENLLKLVLNSLGVAPHTKEKMKNIDFDAEKMYAM